MKDDSLVVVIERNLKTPPEKEKDLAWRSFTLKLHGNTSLSEGSFCQIVCRLREGRLKIESTEVIEGKPKPKIKPKTSQAPDSTVKDGALSQLPTPVAPPERQTPTPSLPAVKALAGVPTLQVEILAEDASLPPLPLPPPLEPAQETAKEVVNPGTPVLIRPNPPRTTPKPSQLPPVKKPVRHGN